MKTSSLFVPFLGLMSLVGCAASSDTEERGGTVSNIEQSTPAKAPPEGAYHRAPEEARDGLLTITNTLDDAIEFEITGTITITEEDGDPGQVGTHEGFADGLAVLDGDEYVFHGEDDCELRFRVEHEAGGVTIDVKQREDGICQPNPLVTLEGVYTFAPKALPK